MPNKMDAHEFKFPDEADEDKTVALQQDEDELDIEIEDDTPEEDRGHKPMPKEVVQQIEADELEEYSEKAKDCLLYTSPSPRDYAASRMPSSA